MLNDVREIAQDLINTNYNARWMELSLNDRYECDIEFLILRVRDKKTGVETILRQPAAIYYDPSVTIH